MGRELVLSEEAPDRNATEAAAMRLLARRDYSTGELRTKLTQKGHVLEIVDALIDEYLERGWMDDARFAETQSAILVRKGWGPLQITKKLTQHGVDRTLASEVVDRLDVSWMELARDRVRSKFGEEFDTAKAFRHLVYRGFPQNIARRVVFED